MADPPTRRTILKALGLGATATTATASASASTSTNQDDCPDCNDPDAEGCPLENTITVKLDYGGDECHYHIKVTGYIKQQGSAFRPTASVEGTLTPQGDLHGDNESCTFRYSGELQAVSLDGAGNVHISQPSPCDPDDH